MQAKWQCSECGRVTDRLAVHHIKPIEDTNDPDEMEHRDPHEGETEEERKRRLHKMYCAHPQEHEFVIKGEHIMARNKKMAMKIYANRHPEAKGKRRKNK